MPHPHFQLWLVSLCVDSCQSVSLGSPVVCLQSHPGHWPWETPGAATRVISKSPSTFAWHSAAASAFERSCPFLSFTVVSAGFYRGAQTYPLITRSSLPCLTDVIIALNRVIPSSLWSSLLKCFFFNFYPSCTCLPDFFFWNLATMTYSSVQTLSISILLYEASIRIDFTEHFGDQGRRVVRLETALVARPLLTHPQIMKKKPLPLNPSTPYIYLWGVE